MALWANSVYFTKHVNPNNYTHLVYHPLMRHPFLSSWVGMTAMAEAKLPCKSKAAGPWEMCNIKTKVENRVKDFAPIQRTRALSDLLNSSCIYFSPHSFQVHSNTGFSCSPFSPLLPEGAFYLVNMTMSFCCVHHSLGLKQGPWWVSHGIPLHSHVSLLIAFWSMVQPY